MACARVTGFGAASKRAKDEARLAHAARAEPGTVIAAAAAVAGAIEDAAAAVAGVVAGGAGGVTSMLCRSTAHAPSSVVGLAGAWRVLKGAEKGKVPPPAATADGARTAAWSSCTARASTFTSPASATASCHAESAAQSAAKRSTMAAAPAGARVITRRAARKRPPPVSELDVRTWLLWSCDKR